MRPFTFTLLAATCGLMLSTGCASLGKHRWITLFDGKSVEAFRGYRQVEFPHQSWKVVDGALCAVPGEGTDLVTLRTFRDFDLEFDWKVAPGANSGVMYRVTEEGDEAWQTGPEMQVLDDTLHKDGKDPKTSAGALYDLVAPNESKVLAPVGEWNHSSIVMRKGRVDYWLNGRRILSYTWNGPGMRELIAGTKFKETPRFMAREEGRIAFQHHGDAVCYRRIRIRPL